MDMDTSIFIVDPHIWNKAFDRWPAQTDWLFGYSVVLSINQYSYTQPQN